ncbi:hypothetical protein QEW_3327 [Clostridioides difficile CD160]|nr:hypothetical protein QEW_3327 [Clostridioides difficile CD160]
MYQINIPYLYFFFKLYIIPIINALRPYKVDEISSTFNFIS